TQGVRVSAALAGGAVQFAYACQLRSSGEFPGVEGEAGQRGVVVPDDAEQGCASELGTVVDPGSERLAAQSLDAAVPVADHGAACRSFSAAVYAALISAANPSSRTTWAVVGPVRAASSLVIIACENELLSWTKTMCRSMTRVPS